MTATQLMEKAQPMSDADMERVALLNKAQRLFAQFRKGHVSYALRQEAKRLRINAEKDANNAAFAETRVERLSKRAAHRFGWGGWDGRRKR